MEDFPFHQNHNYGTESGFELTENEFGRPTLRRIDSDWSLPLSNTADFLATAPSRVLRQRIEQRRPLLPENLTGVDFSVLSKEAIERIYRDYFTATEQLKDCREMARMLQVFESGSREKYESRGPYIHPKPLCFLSDQERTNWATAYEDVEHSDLWSAFQTASKTRQKPLDAYTPKTWIALVKSPQANWITDSNWRQIPWHVWAFAIVSGPGKHGKNLFIYDCDGGSLMRRHKSVKLNEVHGSIARFYNKIRATWRINQVFMGNIHDDFISDTMEWAQYDDTSIEIDENHCIGHTMRWIHKMSWMRDSHFDPEDKEHSLKDPRWESFVEMEYLTEHYTAK
ncbi:unnamed protein product [Zymoseptoria tritici ST99CH_3D7]|uniref:Uncharacterized protein n=1 Tax=Zymoseptoria tritici (strain ST99CH_3D7) TaxID=1276538 RepID=A0A1X7RPJ1_ZYMT9|nr:unnamed protein product [Zymoseptoria tritici ST99CH_3D7]